MTDWTRFALFVAPPPGPLADFAAQWLGWDPVHGLALAHPELAGLPRPVEEITRTPRKYGFHGTIRAPFRPAPGVADCALHQRLFELCRDLPPVEIDRLAIGRLGDFLALLPRGDTAPLDRLAASAVRGSDPLRASLTAAERARRQPERLDPTRRALLDRWGYPHVMQAFRFHMTLTGPLPEKDQSAVEATLMPVLAPLLPRPFRIDHLCLFGEAPDGRFRLVHRYPLGG